MDEHHQDRKFGNDEGGQREALIPEIVDRGDRDRSPGWGPGAPFGDRERLGGMLFGPRSFRGGRVQVYGCSPGCLILSLAISVIASILLTVLLNAIF